MGLFFEDFENSEPLKTGSRTIAESDVLTFAALTGDFVRLHTDEEYAKTTRFGRRIAHGALVFSISVGLVTATSVLDDTALAFAGVDRLRFVGPVFLGDAVHVVKRVMERREVGPASGLVVFETRVLNQRDELVLVYLDKMLVKRRSPTAEGTGNPT